MSLAADIYSTVARERRRWYARHPDWRRRLVRPVVSVGNIAAGGRGKTPVVAWVARALRDAGHRPAILTRGYARAAATDGVTVVSDGRRLLADLDHAGDEPLMLARQLPDVPVLVSGDRYMAGRLAERRFDCTVHVLDDGFQHFELERDVDLVLVSPDDVERPLTLPAGRLREPLDVVRVASALIVCDAGPGRAAEVGQAVGVRDVFVLERALERPRLLEPAVGGAVPDTGTRVLAVAGIATPERFFAGIEAAGWTVAGRVAFRDHHRFTRADMERIAAAMRMARADIVLTTEKDIVRMEPLGPPPVPVASVPLRVSVEPAREFTAWLMGRVGRQPGHTG
jgi:tetraacyldisaccharide 4'-kinase